jgi:hypothetical protein
MKAYEFISTVDNGIIHVPEKYRDKIRSNVKVIVLLEEAREKTVGEFSAFRIPTKGFKFDREAANERR